MRPMLVVSALLVLGEVFAQDAPSQNQPHPSPTGQARFEALVARIHDFQRRHSVTVHAADSPTAVPRGTQLEIFFARFRGVDDVSFAQVALEQVGATGSDVDVLREAQNIPAAKPSADICPLLLGGSLADADGLLIANTVNAVNAEWDRATAAPYQDIIDRLSPRVRANVLQGIDSVAVGVVSTNLDHLGMALEDPDLYKTMTIGYCRGKRHAMAKRPAVTRQGPVGNSLDVAR